MNRRPPRSNLRVSRTRDRLAIVSISVYRVHWGRKVMRATLTGVAFASALTLVCFQKCCCGSGRRRSHEAGCNCHFDSARSAILRASHPARYHQMLPAIHRGTARLPPLPSLVVVKRAPVVFVDLIAVRDLNPGAGAEGMGQTQCVFRVIRMFLRTAVERAMRRRRSMYRNLDLLHT